MRRVGSSFVLVTCLPVYARIRDDPNVRCSHIPPTLYLFVSSVPAHADKTENAHIHTHARTRTSDTVLWQINGKDLPLSDFGVLRPIELVEKELTDTVYYTREVSCIHVYIYVYI